MSDPVLGDVAFAGMKEGYFLAMYYRSICAFALVHTLAQKHPDNCVRYAIVDGVRRPVRFIGHLHNGKRLFKCDHLRHKWMNNQPLGRINKNPRRKVVCHKQGCVNEGCSACMETMNPFYCSSICSGNIPQGVLAKKKNVKTTTFTILPSQKYIPPLKKVRFEPSEVDVTATIDSDELLRECLQTTTDCFSSLDDFFPVD